MVYDINWTPNHCKFAEILVVLIKDIRLKVLLTTHSPNLMLALNVHAKKAGIVSDSHFYLAEKISDSHYSQMRLLNHYYGNPGITIKVENGTDKIRSITHLRNELNHVILTEEECEKIALDVLRSKVSDISRFKMESSFDEIWNTYDFRFEGNINGVLTTETLSVSVYVDGLLMHVSGTMIDSFEKIDISKIETGKIVEDYKTALTKAIEKETRNTGYEIISEHLTILPDGSLAMCYDVKMNGKSGLYRLYLTEAK